MGYPIPIKLLLKNFKSHKSTIIPLGHVKDKCYTMGISGSGKSSILEAMQYALGREISNNEEFFHYTNLKGEDALRYEDHALIELTVVNIGPDFIRAYDENEELRVVLEAFRGKKNKRYVHRANGDIERITLSNLREFGNYNDPLIFVDDTKTSVWSMLKPKQRYSEVAKFMKIEEFESNVNLTKKEFSKAQNILDKAEEDLNLAYIEFKSITEKYNRYFKKKEKEKELKDTELECLKAKLFENIEKFEELQDDMSHASESIENLKMNIEKLRSQINSDENKIIGLKTNIQGQLQKKEELISQRDSLFLEISIFDSRFKLLKNELEAQGKKFPEQDERYIIESRLGEITSSIIEKSLNIAENKKLKAKYEGDLELRRKDKLPLDNDILRLQKSLSDNDIPFEILAKTLDIKKKCEDWRDYLERALGNFRLGLIVEEKNRLKAQELNRRLNTRAFLLYPVSKYAQQSEKSLRSWDDLLSIETSKISVRTVTDFLNLVMSSTYFAETPDEKENYLLKKPRSTIFCKDGFNYRIYSQRKVNLKGLSYYIGKGASERQIKILESQILDIETIIKDLEEELGEEQKHQSDLSTALEFIDLSIKEPDFQGKKEQKRILDEEISELSSDLANPQERIMSIENEISRNKELRASYKDESERTRELFIDLQTRITEISQLFNVTFNKFYIKQDPVLEGLDLSKVEIIETYKDKDYEYKGINSNIISRLKEEERPIEESKLLEYKIKGIEDVLETFKDLPDDIVKIYEDQKLRIESIEKEKEEFSINRLKCQEKFNRAVENLENELKKWEKTVSKKFQEILRDLKLDGVLNFSKIGEGQYELNISVSKIEGGSLLPLERSGFSKGQKRRVSIAFQTAILTQSNSSFFVWDEFDEGLDNYHRELLAKAIQNHLPNKKLIGITPTHPIRGYLEAFDWIIELFLDNNENTQVQMVKFSDKIKREKFITDVF